MGFKWEKYLELAQYLYNNSEKFPDKEACCRAAVSRAYYAAYGTVCVYIKNTDDKNFDGGDCHQKIKQHLKNSGNRSKRTIANQLNMILQNRKKADYDDVIINENPARMAGKSLHFANRIMISLEQLNQERP